MSDLGELIDRQRRLLAEAAGVQVEICMAVGDRDGAQKALKEMKALTTARQAAAWMEPCYFVGQGRADGATLRQEAHS